MSERSCGSTGPIETTPKGFDESELLKKTQVTLGRVLDHFDSEPDNELIDEVQERYHEIGRAMIANRETPPKLLRTPELVSQIALHADMIDHLASKGPSRELYEELHKSDEILSGVDQRRVLLDYIKDLQVTLTTEAKDE